MFILRHTAAAMLITAALCGAGRAPGAEESVAKADLPVTRVTLYTSGVGYFERSGQVEGDAAETLLFPVDQINDVLKSLVLLDPGGIQPVTYAAQDPVEKQLQAYGIDISDNPSRADLLNRMRGASATITATVGGAPSSFTGTIVGVESRTVTLTQGAGTTTVDTLNFLSDDGLHAIDLADITAISLADPDLNSELRDALSVVAHGRDAGKRPVNLHFHGSGRRSVMVGYLAQTPLWQTTYRLVLGQGRSASLLQGWALVQNTGQDDWNDVDLSLVSGRPISFIQDLYTPVYIQRTVVHPQVANAPGPQTYAGDMAKTEPSEVRAELSAAAAPPVGAAMDVESAPTSVSGTPVGSQLSLSWNNTSTAASATYYNSIEMRDALHGAIGTSGAKLGTALFRYDIKVPVTVPRGQSAMIPFVATPVEVEPVSIYNAGVLGDHPLSGARLKNTSGMHLMGGPLTVFDGDGNSATSYVGDALIDDTEPGQTRLISYAIDQAVDAAVKSVNNSATTAITINKGVLIITERQESDTRYTFKNNASHVRTVVVEQSDPGGTWKLSEPKAATEQTASVYRFDVSSPAGASTNLDVKFVCPTETTFALVDDDLDTLVAYMKSGEESDAVKAALTEVIDRRRKIADVQQALSNRNAQLEAIADGQQRIRNNMRELDHASTLYKRYVSELNDQETAIQTLHNAVDSINQQISAEQNDLSDYVAKLTLN